MTLKTRNNQLDRSNSHLCRMSLLCRLYLQSHTCILQDMMCIRLDSGNYKSHKVFYSPWNSWARNSQSTLQDTNCNLWLYRSCSCLNILGTCCSARRNPRHIWGRYPVDLRHRFDKKRCIEYRSSWNERNPHLERACILRCTWCRWSRFGSSGSSESSPWSTEKLS